MADLKTLIKQGEGISVEFKECRRTLNRDIYKTVCAFLNRHGGTLLLGVADAGELTGVEPDSMEQIKKDFVTAINNPQKLHPPAYLSIDEVEVEGKMILRIHVPEKQQQTPRLRRTESGHIHTFSKESRHRRFFPGDPSGG